MRMSRGMRESGQKLKIGISVYVSTGHTWCCRWPWGGRKWNRNHTLSSTVIHTCTHNPHLLSDKHFSSAARTFCSHLYWSSQCGKEGDQMAKGKALSFRAPRCNTMNDLPHPKPAPLL